jgi:autotransporter-associated beta strand protein
MKFIKILVSAVLGVLLFPDTVLGQQRGRPTLNAERTTFVADNGRLLRGPFTSSEWSTPAPYTQLANMKTLGFNAIHLYGESFNLTYPNAGSTAPGYAVKRIDQIVKDTRELGLYLIITIGNGAENGNHNRLYAEDFWKFYAPRYANESHVIYEIHNEPVGWGPSYVTAQNPPGAMTMEVNCYNIIRQFAPNTPVLLFSYSVLGGTSGANGALSDIQSFNQAVFGTPTVTWTNIAMGFHGYAGARETAIAISNILAAGYPCFMTEFVSEPWGGETHGLDVVLTAALERMGVSWLTFSFVPPWGVSSDITTPSIYSERVQRSGLSWIPDFGTFPVNRGTYGNNGLPWTTPDYVSNKLAGTLRIEAENFDNGGKNVAYSNSKTVNIGGQYRTNDTVSIESTEDVGGGYNAGYILGGDWLEYTINVPVAATYDLRLRVAGLSAGIVQILASDEDLTGSWILPATGGWQTWATATRTVMLPAGQHRLRISVINGGFNLNWLELAPTTTGALPDGIYRIQNVASTNALDLDASQRVVSAPISTSPSQRWQLRHIGGGSYRVTSPTNNWNWNTWITALHLTSWWGAGADQSFLIIPVGSGQFRIVSSGNGRVFQPSTGSAALLDRVVYTGADTQKWTFGAKYWDTSSGDGLQGGAGTWDVNSTATWNATLDGSAPLSKFWTSDTAYFLTGVVNSVDLAGTVAVDSIQQTVNGTATTINGGTLVLAGSNPLSNGVGSGNAALTINSAVQINNLPITVNAVQQIILGQGLAGTGNVTKVGASVLTLGAASPFEGKLLLDGGTVNINGDAVNVQGISFGSTAGSSIPAALNLDGNVVTTGINLQSYGNNTLSIATGRTLTVNGPAMFGFNGVDAPGSGTAMLVASGGGALTINTVDGNFIVAGGKAGETVNVDFSSLAKLTVNTGLNGNVYLGVSATNTSDVLKLAATTNINTGTLYVGDAKGGGTYSLFLGGGVNTIKADNLYLAQKSGNNNSSDGSITFRADDTTGSLQVRAADGVGRANFYQNDNASTIGRTLTSTFDVSGHFADLWLNMLVIGRRNGSGTPSTLTTDTFKWDRGALDVANQVILEQAPDNAGSGKTYSGVMTIGSAASTPADTAVLSGGVLIAQNRGTISGSIASGTLNIGGGTVTSGSIILGDLVGGAASRQSKATLNLTGGTLNMTGPIVAGTTGGTGTKTTTFTLNGGSLELAGNSLGATGSGAIGTLSFLSGTLSNVGGINGTASLTKTGNGTLMLSGNNTFTGSVSVDGGTLALVGNVASSVVTTAAGVLAPQGTPLIAGSLTLGTSGTLRVRINGTTVGSGYDQLAVGGNVTLAGALEVQAGAGLAPGTRFMVLNKTSAGAFAGTFSGRPEGGSFTASGYTWIISYTGGNGNDVVLSIASPLQQWRQTHFGSIAGAGTAVDTADPDGDGVVNLLEYALGTVPTSAASVSVPVPSVVGSRLQISFLRARSDVTYIVETTSDLSSGAWSILATNPGSVGQTVTISDTLNLTTANSPRRFMRLRVSSP